MDSLDKKIRAAEEISKRNEAMTDYEKLKNMYETAKEIEPHKAMHMIMDAKTDEERKFYTYIHDMNLQREQKKVVERNLF